MMDLRVLVKLEVVLKRQGATSEIVISWDQFAGVGC